MSFQQTGKVQKIDQTWRKRHSHTLLIEIQNTTITKEGNLSLTYKILYAHLFDS
jgi:hypothetical protein